MMTRLACMLILSALPFAALAHDQEKGPNGGPVMHAETHHVEMVSKGTDLAVFVTDTGNAPVAATGASGRAVIQGDGGTRTVPLSPAAANKLTGTLEGPLQNGARVVISVTLSGGQVVQARFLKN